MTVHVVGNCQAAVLTSCLERMCPGERFVPLARGADVTANSEPGDLILWQLYDLYPAPRTPRRVVTFPVLYYNAFHPDLVRVGPQGRLPAPLGFYHSALVLYGWLHGLDAARTQRLFCEAVFERLGYFRYRETARSALLDAAETAALPLERELAEWTRSGCFMYSVNHPKLAVFAGLARALAPAAELEVRFERPEDYLTDPLRLGPIWPVYREIAQRLGVAGGYVFKPEQLPGEPAPPLLDLEGFIAASFARYATLDRSELVCRRLDDPAYRELEALTRATPRPAPDARAEEKEGGVSPYEGLPDAQFWRRAVERVPPGELDPFVGPPLPIDRATRIATAGSCFAQHVSRVLASSGYTYLVTEPAPRGMNADEARRAQYGVYSARYGNVYTARQLLQLFERAYGTFEPRDVAWERAGGGYADPFRPEVEPGGFTSVDALLADRARHLAAVRTTFEQLDAFVFTLGLTEAWSARADGAVFPLAPGVSAGRFDPATYAFHNFSAAETAADLDAFVRRLAAVNPRASVVLTVSPVPLVATYEPRHVLVSTAASKAALRAAADEIERAHAHVRYFPAYEIVTGAFNRGAYVEDDVRSPAAAGIDHVMRVFFAHCRDAAQPVGAAEALLEEIRRGMDVVCDEEKIA